MLAKELKVEEWVQKTIEQDLCVLKTQRQTDHKGVVFGEERKHIRERERERERERGGGVWSLKKKFGFKCWSGSCRFWVVLEFEDINNKAGFLSSFSFFPKNTFSLLLSDFEIMFWFLSSVTRWQCLHSVYCGRFALSLPNMIWFYFILCQQANMLLLLSNFHFSLHIGIGQVRFFSF